MRGLLVTGGEGPERETLEPYLQGVGLVVAADSGLDTAHALGLSVDLVVGDMDSLSHPEELSRFPRERVLRFDAAKDETDTEIGLRVLKERGATSLTIAGGGGGRTDHFIGILSLFERDDPPELWVTRSAVLELLLGRREVRVTAGEVVSFFPVGPVAKILRSRGLRWPLDGMCLRRGHASLSNEATSDRIEVDIGEGGLLMVRQARGSVSGARQAR